jgi:hypothetical protein
MHYSLFRFLKSNIQYHFLREPVVRYNIHYSTKKFMTFGQELSFAINFVISNVIQLKD